jgi:hypothetical protein
MWKNEKGELHREGDEPAIIRSSGGKEWWKNGERHRDGDEPAVIYSDGGKTWYKNGERHREGDEPAVIYSSGGKEWWKNGKCHREGDEPAIIHSSGGKEWYKNGERHREDDKPAYISTTGYKAWYKNGVQYTPEIVSKPQKEEKEQIDLYADFFFHGEPPITCDEIEIRWFKCWSYEQDHVQGTYVDYILTVVDHYDDQQKFIQNLIRLINLSPRIVQGGTIIYISDTDIDWSETSLEMELEKKEVRTVRVSKIEDVQNVLTNK